MPKLDILVDAVSSFSRLKYFEFSLGHESRGALSQESMTALANSLPLSLAHLSLRESLNDVPRDAGSTEFFQRFPNLDTLQIDGRRLLGVPGGIASTNLRKLGVLEAEVDSRWWDAIAAIDLDAIILLNDCFEDGIGQ